jgi:hypothetical protein
MSFEDIEQGGCAHAARALGISARCHDPMMFLDVGVGDGLSHTSRSAQAVARPSEVDDRRQVTANAETSTRRSAAFRRAAVQVAISEHHIYDYGRLCH